MEPPVNQLICRGCLKVVEYTNNNFGYIEDSTGNLKDMLLYCVPEMDIYTSANPIMCIQCIQILISIYQFKTRFINTENTIRNYLKKHNLPEQIQINLGHVVKDLLEINKQQQQQQILSESGNNTTNSNLPLPELQIRVPLAFVPQLKPMAIPPLRDIQSGMLLNSNTNSTNFNSNTNSTNFNSTNIQQSEDLKENKNNNKIVYHPIESKLRLVIKLSRCDEEILKENTFSNTDRDSLKGEEDIIDLEENKAKGEEDIIDLEENIDEPMQLENDQPVDSMEIPLYIPEDIPEDLPEYLPEEKSNDDQIKNVKIYNCPCMYLTTSLSLFESHKTRCRVGNGGQQNMFKCPHCTHITNRTYALNKHINTMHTKAIWYHCEHCSYRSTDKSCLRRHFRKNHAEQSADFNVNNIMNNTFVCHICNTQSTSEYYFNRHMLKHEDPENITEYECDFCSYHSKDRSNYRKHIFTHSPIQIQCPNCPYSNVSPYQLKLHIKKLHNGNGIQVADCKSDVAIDEIIKSIKLAINNCTDQEGFRYE